MTALTTENTVTLFVSLDYTTYRSMAGEEVY